MARIILVILLILLVGCDGTKVGPNGVTDPIYSNKFERRSDAERDGRRKADIVCLKAGYKKIRILNIFCHISWRTSRPERKYYRA